MEKRTEVGIFMLFVVMVFVGISCQKSPSEWPQWRGPNGNNASLETTWNPGALNQEPVVRWKAQLGKGYSAPAIKGNRLYTLGNVMEVLNGDTAYVDVVYCLNAETGASFWTYKYPSEPGPWAGPRATPNVHDGSVYTLSRFGQAFCLEAATGKVVWQRDLFADSLALDPDFGLSGSPVIHGDLVIYNAGKAGLALNRLTGETVWRSELGKNGFASPVLYDIAGKTKAAIFSRLELYQVEAATGKVDWVIPWKTPYEENIADPIIRDDYLFVSSGHKRGCALLQVSEDDVKIVYENKNMNTQFTSAVFLDGKLYGIDGNARKSCTLKCMDFMTGEVSWEEPIEYAALTLAGRHLLALTESGTLNVIEANPEKYVLVSSAKVIDQHPFDRSMPWHTFCASWTPPVLCNGLIYVRNNYGDFICLDAR